MFSDNVMMVGCG